jgi:hypothetical protein
MTLCGALNMAEVNVPCMASIFCMEASMLDFTAASRAIHF